MQIEADLEELAAAIVREGTAKGLKVATVESCTGGLVSGCITAIPGSSLVLDRAFVTYSVPAKVAMVGVRQATVDRHDVVSEEVAREMCEGGARKSDADVVVSITGYAGPGERTAANPVGKVCFGITRKRPAAGGLICGHMAQDIALETCTETKMFDGGRTDVRRDAVRRALTLVLAAMRA